MSHPAPQNKHLKSPPTITDKISETKSSLHVKWRTTGKVQEFSSSINKTFTLARELGTRLSFFEV